MKTLLVFAATLLCFTLSAQNNGIIIKLKKGYKADAELLKNNLLGINELDAVSIQNHASGIKKLRTGKKSISESYLITYPNTISTDNVINAYKNTGIVEYAEPDAIGSAGGVMASTVNDALYFRQWGLKNDGSFNMAAAVAGADIDMENAWNITQGSNDIIVAVMDSGIKLSHPEFEGRLWANISEIANNGIDDDNNGYIDDIFGWDYANEDNIPSDDHGHGTNVAGIIAANGNNSVGYSGVDRNCRIMTLKGLDANNFGNYSWWMEAIAYAADNGANVINLSVGGNTSSTGLQEAVNYALANNVVVVACMMNTDSGTWYYPARFPNVISVGSTDPDDHRTSPFFWGTSSGSNYGSHISVVAPGNFIYGLSAFSNTNYESYWGGTSQATPLVAGLASLLLAQDPERTPAQIKAIIENTAEDMVGNPLEDTPGFDIYHGHGRINAFLALSQSLSTPAIEDFNKEIMLFPNPSSGVFSIKVNSYPANVTVYNMLGQQILDREITESDTTISVDAKGTYIVNVINAGSTSSKKLIIN